MNRFRQALLLLVLAAAMVAAPAVPLIATAGAAADVHCPQMSGHSGHAEAGHSGHDGTGHDGSRPRVAAMACCLVSCLAFATLPVATMVQTAEAVPAPGREAPLAGRPLRPPVPPPRA